MDAQELITAPASTLTRKQRRERAALKRQIAKAAKVPEGYMLGRVLVTDPSLLPSPPPLPNPLVGDAFGSQIVVRMPGR